MGWSGVGGWSCRSVVVVWGGEALGVVAQSSGRVAQWWGWSLSAWGGRSTPIPVATRLPQPSKTEDTISGFIRVEAAGGAIQLDDCMLMRL